MGNGKHYILPTSDLCLVFHSLQDYIAVVLPVHPSSPSLTIKLRESELGWQLE